MSDGDGWWNGPGKVFHEWPEAWPVWKRWGGGKGNLYRPASETYEANLVSSKAQQYLELNER